MKYLLAVVVLVFGVAIWLFLPPGDLCGSPDYPDQSKSPYRLPYAVGTTHNVRQGNCNYANTHNRKYGGEFAYDFEMPIGTKVIASRAGTVLAIEDKYSDDDHETTHQNQLLIAHDDGTIAAYLHLTQKGALVRAGTSVAAGDVIALSGNSGMSRGPHLHFIVIGCRGIASIRFNCHSFPVTFRNTRPHPNGLQGSPTSEIGGGEWYEALPW